MIQDKIYPAFTDQDEPMTPDEGSEEETETPEEESGSEEEEKGGEEESSEM